MNEEPSEKLDKISNTTLVQVYLYTLIKIPEMMDLKVEL